jgi:hypothetical protein
MAAVGVALMFCAASSSDFCAELRQVDPDSVGHMALWGFALMLPFFAHKIREYFVERRNAR